MATHCLSTDRPQHVAMYAIPYKAANPHAATGIEPHVSTDRARGEARGAGVNWLIDVFSWPATTSAPSGGR